jgi:uncharacterized membrane protein
VLLSGRGEVEAEQAEQALQATSVDWTILRSSWFCQNFSEGFFLDPILAGEFALPVGSVAEPFVDVDDIADIAFAALTDPAHSRQLYEITGPRALSFADAISEIASATGREIKFIPVSADDYRAELVRQGVPNDYIDLVLYLFATVLDGRNTPLADGVQRALGRPPRDFFAFSTFVMPALARLQTTQGIAAMQSMNITAINPLFMLALFGTAVACLFLGVFALLKWHQPSSVYLLVGSLLYLIGTILVTMVFNVPLNDALAAAKPDSPEGADLWTKYLTN